MLIFDIEADNLYHDVTKVHCLVIKNDDGDVWRCNDQGAYRTVEDGLRVLMNANELCGHNVLKYDLPVLRKLYPWFKPQGRVVDTLIIARLLFPETGDSDDALIRRGKFPPKHRGAHRLEAWGYRLGVMKGEYGGDPAIEDPDVREKQKWAEWNKDMEDYCVQDVVVTDALLARLRSRKWPTRAVDVEHATARIISRQEINGFSLDGDAALALLGTLSKERLALEDELKSAFGWWFAPDGKVFTPKKDLARFNYTGGAQLTKVQQVYFNPSSRHHIARVLKLRYGWKPTSFTPSGEPEVSEESLKPLLHLPHVKTVDRYLMVQKRLGQLAEGKEAILKHVRSGKVHGDVNTIGAVTGRMTHSHPNVAQTPRVGSPYGKEFRTLYRAREGWKLVGCDAASLELRILAHYMSRLDGGVYGRAAIEGRKEDGSDIHSLNMRALGITSRDDAKTWFYAFIYGAGDEKLGRIITKSNTPAKNRRLGKELRASFLRNLPAMAKLIDAIKSKARVHKALVGIDGRVLFCRSEHSAPNTLFQSTGAVAMKYALVLLDDNLQAAGLQPGVDYEFVANVHDEWQIECRPEVADAVGKMAVEAIRAAGIALGVRVPLDGEYGIGITWADTH